MQSYYFFHIVRFVKSVRDNVLVCCILRYVVFELINPLIGSMNWNSVCTTLHVITDDMLVWVRSFALVSLILLSTRSLQSLSFFLTHIYSLTNSAHSIFLSTYCCKTHAHFQHIRRARSARTKNYKFFYWKHEKESRALKCMHDICYYLQPALLCIVAGRIERGM